jgi:integrase
MYKRGSVWWTHFRHNGRNFQKSLNTSDRKLAQAIEAKIITELVQGNYYEKPIGSHKTFNNMMDKFMDEHAPNVSIGTRRGYSSYLNHLDSFFKDFILTSISSKMITEYKKLRKDQGAKPASVNKELAMLSKAFSLAVKEWEWLNENPVSKVSYEKENNERDRWLTIDEEKRILEHCPIWIKEIVVFDLSTGLRQDELLSLEWSRVNFILKTILINKSKNGKPRTIPLNQTALDLLIKKSEEKVQSIKDLVFPSKVGSKINPSNLRRSFYRSLNLAKINNFVFHDLRHTFATRLSQRGIDIYKISKLLGHKDIRMTQRYAHHCPDSLRAGVEILEAGYNLATI